MHAQYQQRASQQTKALKLIKTIVRGCTPRKAVLTQGGDPVFVAARGTKLTTISSVKVTRAGAEVPGIAESLDKSQLPAILKIMLKASSQAPIANTYQLSVFDASGRKINDVPNTILTIEVKAPQTLAATTTRTFRQRAAELRKPSSAFGIMMPDLGISDLRAPDPLHEGKIQVIKVAWKNFGRSASENKQYLVVLWYRSSHENAWKPFGTKLYSDPLAPGQQIALTFIKDANHSLPGGDYHFRVVVDENKTLKDRNRANNAVEKSLSVKKARPASGISTTAGG